MQRVIGSVVVSVLLGGFTVAVAQLPPDIMADSYLLRAEQAVRDGDQARALAAINNILDLQNEYELNLPDDFHFRYAKAAAAAGLPEPALESVEKYLLVAGRDGQHYVESLELMNQMQDTMAAGKEPQAASTELPSAAPLASQSPIEAQSGVGGTPDGETEKRDPLNAAGTTEAQPAPECDLSAWNTEEYFQTATAKDVTACLDAGADLKTRDDYKSTSLHLAAKSNKNPEVTEFLLDAGANLNATDESFWGKSIGLRWTPLHLAARDNENLAVIKVLLDAGADPNRHSLSGSPLHLAARDNENPAVIKVLLDAGADLEPTDDDGHTPLHLAARDNENPAIAQTLIGAGSNLKALDEDGLTPLQHANKNNKKPAHSKASARRLRHAGKAIPVQVGWTRPSE